MKNDKYFKGVVQPEMITLSSFTLTNVIQTSMTYFHYYI